MQLSKQNIQAIIENLHKEVSPVLIILFGSAAKGTQRKDSDIDIAYLSNIESDEYIKFCLSQTLAGVLNKEVDLVDLKKASTVLQAQIVKNGKVIYCEDENIRMYFEMHVLKKYARLNEERKVILDSIKERGSIYG